MTDSWWDEKTRKFPSGFKINQSVKVFHKNWKYPNDIYKAVNTGTLRLFTEETEESIQNTGLQLRQADGLTAGISQRGFPDIPCPRFHETAPSFSVSFPLIAWVETIRAHKWHNGAGGGENTSEQHFSLSTSFYLGFSRPKRWLSTWPFICNYLRSHNVLISLERLHVYRV